MSFKDWLIEELSRLVKERDEKNRILKSTIEELRKTINKLIEDIDNLQNYDSPYDWGE